MEEGEYRRRVERACANRHDGYNCAQAAACAICDIAGLDEDAAFRVTEAFGGGMGSFKHMCGAVTGPLAMLGYANSAGLDRRPSNESTYAMASDFVDAFGVAYGGRLTCAELRPSDPAARDGACQGYVASGVRIALDMLMRGGAA